jgi:hypothetical protein
MQFFGLILLLHVASCLQPPQHSNRLLVSYFAPFFSPCGYSSEAWAFALGLSALDGVGLELVHHGDTADQSFIRSLPESHYRLASLFHRDARPRIVICHSTPDAWSLPRPQWPTPPALECPPPHGREFLIGRTM